MGKSIGPTPRSTASSPVQNLRPAGGRLLLPATPATSPPRAIHELPPRLLTSATSASRYHPRWGLHDQPAAAQTARCVCQRAALAMESRLSKGLQLSRARRPMSARCVLQFALAHLCVQKRGSVPASPARRSARERALRTLAPAALWRPAALGHLSASLQPRPARAPQPVLRVRPAAAIPVTPTASLCAPLWRQSSAPSRYLCALGAFSLHVAVARAYRLRAAVASRQPLSATPTLWVWVRAGMSWGARQHALLRPHAWRAACRG